MGKLVDGKEDPREVKGMGEHGAVEAGKGTAAEIDFKAAEAGKVELGEFGAQHGPSPAEGGLGVHRGRRMPPEFSRKTAQRISPEMTG